MNKLYEDRIKELEDELMEVAAQKHELAAMLNKKLGCDAAAKTIKRSANRIVKLVEKGVSQ